MASFGTITHHWKRPVWQLCAGRQSLNLNLCHERVFQGQMIPSVDKQLVFEVLGRVEVLAGRLLSVATSLQCEPLLKNCGTKKNDVSKAIRLPKTKDQTLYEV